MRWYFLRLSPGDLRPLPGEDMEAFLRGETPLPADESQRVHYIGVEVQSRSGTALGIRSMWFARCRVHENGRLDQAHMLEVANAKKEMERRIEESLDGLPPGLAELTPEDRFQARWTRLQSRWDPEPADIEALREIVNGRAGWTMLP